MFAAVALALAGALLAALWPTAAVVLGLLVVVLALCIRAPEYGFALALVLYSFEGTIKMRLSFEGAPSAVALGAVVLDLAFLASLAALLLRDRGRSLLELWGRATRLERVAAALVGAWLVLSVLQIPVAGNLTNGLEGFRLTQLYVPAALGGIVLAARLGEERLAVLLLGVIALAVLYAAFRGITGPTRHEQLFAEQRAFNSTFGELGRNTGSFTGPVGLVSFLVPAAVICLVLGFLRPQRRWLFGLGFALAMTGILASFVRTALVAVVAGAALMALVMLLEQSKSRRRGVYAVGLVIVVLAGGYGAALLAGEVSPTAEDRAESLANPFSDDSVTTRFDTWERTLDKVAEEPLGTGLGTVGRATAKGRKAAFTDSSYLKILQEQGPLGALLFLGGFGGLLVMAGIRLARAGPSQRSLGTAALAGFGGFLVLMLMGEYVEQPGKLLAWTLLGVALWEASRPAAVTARDYEWPSRRSIAGALQSIGGRLRRLPRPLVAAMLTATVAMVAVPAAVRLASQSKYRSTTAELLAPGPGATWEPRIEQLLDDPSFQQGVANDLDTVANVDVRQVSVRYIRRGEQLRFAVTARASTPRQARRLAQATGRGLLGATYFVSQARVQGEQQRLRRRLRAGDLAPAEAAQVRKRLSSIKLATAASSLYLAQEIETSRPRSGPLVDRLASDLSGKLAPPPSAAWVGVAAFIFALLLGVAGLIATAVGRLRLPLAG